MNNNEDGRKSKSNDHVDSSYKITAETNILTKGVYSAIKHNDPASARQNRKRVLDQHRLIAKGNHYYSIFSPIFSLFPTSLFYLQHSPLFT
jgi:hypothetical protein